MKQQLTEALAVSEALLAPGEASRLTIEQIKDSRRVVNTAARLVERLLPGECENCGGTGIAGVHRHIKQSTGEHLGDQDVPCGFCDDGQVWDEGIVETVAKAFYESAYNEMTDLEWHQLDELFRERLRKQARAVLSALVELLTEKVE